MFIINYKSEIIRFKKGMSKDAVTGILGEPFKIEHNIHKENEKLIFKLEDGRPKSVLYSILFRDDQLVYVAKLN
jgi:hypothetical protein